MPPLKPVVITSAGTQFIAPFSCFACRANNYSPLVSTKSPFSAPSREAKKPLFKEPAEVWEVAAEGGLGSVGRGRPTRKNTDVIVSATKQPRKPHPHPFPARGISANHSCQPPIWNGRSVISNKVRGEKWLRLKRSHFKNPSTLFPHSRRRQDHRECTAFADAAVDGQFALMSQQHMFDDGQSQASAAGGAGTATVNAVETFG